MRYVVSHSSLSYFSRGWIPTFGVPAVGHCLILSVLRPNRGCNLTRRPRCVERKRARRTRACSGVLGRILPMSRIRVNLGQRRVFPSCQRNRHWRSTERQPRSPARSAPLANGRSADTGRASHATRIGTTVIDGWTRAKRGSRFRRKAARQAQNAWVT